MNCVFSASIGFIPRLIKSDTFFLRVAIAAIAGFISNTSLARKYVSSLLDSSARRGRLMFK